MNAVLDHLWLYMELIIAQSFAFFQLELKIDSSMSTDKLTIPAPADFRTRLSTCIVTAQIELTYASIQ
jgi:hypothetical protein